METIPKRCDGNATAERKEFVRLQEAFAEEIRCCQSTHKVVVAGCIGL
jgi:hypothetical protein